MLTSDDLLFTCGVTKLRYQTRSRQNQCLHVAVNCELLTFSVTKHGVHIDGIIRSVL